MTVIDLGRVRRALALLDRLVLEHPRLTTASARERLADLLADDATDERNQRSDDATDEKKEDR